MSEQTPLPQPGWYPDPDGTPNRQRYWDGHNWTPRVQQTSSDVPTESAPNPTRAKLPWIIAAITSVIAVVALIFTLITVNSGRTPGPAPTTTATAPITAGSPSSAPSSIDPCYLNDNIATNGIITVKIPEHWAGYGLRPDWAPTCGSGGRSYVILDTWYMYAIVGTVDDKKNQPAKDVASYIWEWNRTQAYTGMTITSATINRNEATDVQGLQGWRITGEVKVSGQKVAGDVVDILVLESADGTRSALYTVRPIGDAERQAEMDAVWASIQVTKK